MIDPPIEKKPSDHRQVSEQINFAHFDDGLEHLKAVCSLLRAFSVAPSAVTLLNAKDQQNIFLLLLSKAEKAKCKLEQINSDPSK